MCELIGGEKPLWREDGKDRHTYSKEGDTTRHSTLSFYPTDFTRVEWLKRPTTTIMEQLRIHIIMIYSYQFGHFAILSIVMMHAQFVIVSLC